VNLTRGASAILKVTAIHELLGYKSIYRDAPAAGTGTAVYTAVPKEQAVPLEPNRSHVRRFAGKEPWILKDTGYSRVVKNDL
jgi:hypothetical protein